MMSDSGYDANCQYSRVMLPSSSSSSSSTPHFHPTSSSSFPLPPSTPTPLPLSLSVIWDLHSIPIPTHLSVNHVMNRLTSVLSAYGYVDSIRCICWSPSSLTSDSLVHPSHPQHRVHTNVSEEEKNHDVASLSTPLHVKRGLQQHGVEVKEVTMAPFIRSSHSSSVHAADIVHACDWAFVNEIIRITLAVASRPSNMDRSELPLRISKSALVLVTNQEELARTLQIIRQANVFAQILLIYCRESMSAPGLLIHQATASMDWNQMMQTQVQSESHSASQTTSASATAFRQRGDRTSNLPLQPRTSAQWEFPQNPVPQEIMSNPLTTGLLTHHSLTSGSVSSAHSSNRTSPYSHLSHSNTTPRSLSYASTVVSPSRNQSPHYNLSSRRSSTISTASDSVIDYHDHMTSSSDHGRSMMGAIIDVPRALESTTTNIADLACELQLERLPAKLKSMVIALKSVIDYCKTEKIIPRESVIKKRLLDTTIGVTNPCLANEVDFESLLGLSVQVGICMIEGNAPQRVIYPASGPFPCSDFFQPTSRLSVRETLELLHWLCQVRPEVDRGRFGFAQHMSIAAPETIRRLPHGVLVELTQLLLNQKILLFRKGKVSVSHHLPYADLKSIANLSVSVPPHTALLPTTKYASGTAASKNGNDADLPFPSNSSDSSNISYSCNVKPSLHIHHEHELPLRATSAPTSPVMQRSSEVQFSLGHNTPIRAWINAPSYVNDTAVTREQRNNTSNVCFNSGVSQSHVAAPSCINSTQESTEIKHMEIRSTRGTDRESAVCDLPSSADGTYVHQFSHLYLQSKWGPLLTSSLSNCKQRFPFAALWHLELSSQWFAQQTNESQSGTYQPDSH